jgi:hypothetical protein
MNNNGMEKIFWQQCSEAQVQVYAEFPGIWCSTDTGMENFAP